MRSTHDYQALVWNILKRAGEMILCLPDALKHEGAEILHFLRQHGYFGFPTGIVGEYEVGSWIGRVGNPQRKNEGVAIVPCFTDDVPPVVYPVRNAFICPGRFFYSDQAIILYTVNRWSLSELALTLLHEARHARHRLGGTLEDLVPLDKNMCLHETNTWIFMLNLINGWGEDYWRSAVDKEIAWISQQYYPQLALNTLSLQSSPHYWKELDMVFGVCKHDDVCRLRKEIVSLQANMEYWSAKNSVWTCEQVCHIIVAHFYR